MDAISHTNNLQSMIDRMTHHIRSMGEILKRAFEILEEGGIIKLCKTSVNFCMGGIDPTYRYRFKLKTLQNSVINDILYEAPANPYKKILVKPKNINWKIREPNNIESYPTEDGPRHSKPEHGGLGQIKPGNWDSTEYCDKITKSSNVMVFKEVFEENKKWEETENWSHLAKKRKKDKKHINSGFKSLEDYLKSHFAQYEELYTKIKKQGYQEGHNGINRSAGHETDIRDRLEVLVTINRNGEIYLFDGHHRLGIARVLGLEIPVQVLCRHKQWQKVRDNIYKNGFSGRYDQDLQNHPDLQDVIQDHET